VLEVAAEVEVVVVNTAVVGTADIVVVAVLVVAGPYADSTHNFFLPDPREKLS